MTHWLNRRLVGAVCLLGATLLIIGLVPPWIIKIDYSPPTTVSYSLWQLLVSDAHPFSSDWWILAALTLAPLLLVVTLQFAIAIAGLNSRGTRLLFALGLIFAWLVSAYYLYAARVYYCWFYAGCAATSGPWANPGERILAPGFWLMLGGFLISIGSDFALLLSARRPTT